MCSYMIDCEIDLLPHSYKVGMCVLLISLRLTRFQMQHCIILPQQEAKITFNNKLQQIGSSG